MVSSRPPNYYMPEVPKPVLGSGTQKCLVSKSVFGVKSTRMAHSGMGRLVGSGRVHDTTMNMDNSVLGAEKSEHIVFPMSISRGLFQRDLNLIIYAAIMLVSIRDTLKRYLAA